MNSFQSSLKGVFGAWGGTDVLSPQRTPAAWPALKLAPFPRPERPAKERLAKVVEREIVPRLLAANRPASNSDEPTLRGSDRVLAVDLKAVEAFTWAVLSRNAERMSEQIKALLQEGICEEKIYFELLAPSALLLAELWGEDRISYIEVTVSLNRLEQVIHGFVDSTPYNGDWQASSRSALFAPTPGGQQTFGFYIMEELFRWAGWRTWVEINTDNTDISAKVRCHWFDAFCLSVTREGDIDAASAMIDAVRRMSRNRDLHVLAYGHLCIESPWVLGAIGANTAVSNANEALIIMDQVMTCPPTD